MTQEELAKAAGVNVITISRIELGQGAQMGTIRKLAKALGVRPSDILGD